MSVKIIEIKIRNFVVTANNRLRFVFPFFFWFSKPKVFNKMKLS